MPLSKSKSYKKTTRFKSDYPKPPVRRPNGRARIQHPNSARETRTEEEPKNPNPAYAVKSDDGNKDQAVGQKTEPRYRIEYPKEETKRNPNPAYALKSDDGKNRILILKLVCGDTHQGKTKTEHPNPAVPNQPQLKPNSEPRTNIFLLYSRC